MKSGPNRTWRIILWGSSLPALLAASFLYFPASLNGPVLCPWKLVLGLPCPGCGMTRALGEATHGAFREAFGFHPLWPLILGYLAFLWIYKLIETARGRPPELPTYRIGGTAIVVILAFWVVRLAWFFAHGGTAIMAHENGIARLLRLLRLSS